MQSISEWLQSLGLERYTEVFHENGLDLAAIALVTESDLEKIGVLLGHRRKLLKAAAELNSTTSPARGSEAEATPVAPAPAASRGAAAERRQLTVMFCDLVDCNSHYGSIIVSTEDAMKLTKPERVELTKRASGRTLRAEDARRARCILLLADEHTWVQVRDKLGCNDSFIARWSERFESQRLAGLFSRHKGSEARTLSPALEARILERTRQAPPDGSTHWSTRKLAKVLKTHHMTVARVWAKHGLKPHRLERYMASDDTQFEPKAADIIGLYLNPPAHAAVFCVDEKSAIQALDRLDPVLPLSPGRAERHGFEYYRHGTLSLYAAFNTKTGEVLGKTAQRHTSAEFVAFLADIVAHQPKGKEIHVIADNLSAHKTKQVEQFLSEHPKLSIHYTPTYSSWLNQVELWFAKIERDVVSRGVFTSVKDLARKLMRYIREYNKAPKTVKWKYFDPTRRITTESAVTVH